jgi:hypothetical protein
MNNIVLDTNILIYLLQGNTALREVLDDKNWFISFITEMELLIKPGITAMELKAVRSILNECFIIEMNDAIKTEAIQNARLYKLKLADSIVLASARVNNIPFITADSIFKKIAQDAQDVLLFIP